MSVESQTPADWYPDPDSPGILRFWDGAAWTERRKPMVRAPQQPDVADGVFRGLVVFVCFAVLVGCAVFMLVALSRG